ncbi:MAG: hypothetical protein FJ090_11085 [Deltaproteobacteria bacterium]|nr:hypothetical protein [Deltaproteobacteria bacterium]
MLERSPWLPLALVATACALFQVAGVLQAPASLVAGSDLTEAPAHLWALWNAAHDLFEHGPLIREADINYPDGFRLHLMDPINLVVFAPVYWLAGGGPAGAALGWNTLHGVAPLVGAIGLWALLKRVLGPSPCLAWAAGLAAAIYLACPFFLLYHRMGRTEYLPALLYPLHLAYFHRWMRRPPGIDGAGIDAPPPAWVGVAAALSLSAVALGGTYLALFCLLGNGVLGLAWSRGLGWREATWRLAAVATLAVLPVLPATWALFEAWPTGKQTELAGGMWEFDDSEANAGTALLTALRLAPPRMRSDLDYVPYVGTVAVLLAAAAAWVRPRRALPWLVLVLLTFLMGSGFRLYLGAITDDFDGLTMPPLALTRLLPPLQHIRSWSRIMVLGSLAAAVGAAVFLAWCWPRLGARGPRLAQALMAVCLLDQLNWPYPPAWPPRNFSASPPPAMEAAVATLPPGAVVALPMDLPMLLPWGAEEQGLWPTWQLGIGRPTSNNFQGEYDHFVGTLFGQAVVSRQRLCHQTLASRCTARDLDGREQTLLAAIDEDLEENPLDDTTIKAEIASFWWDGYGGIVLAEEVEGAGGLRELLTDLIGEPTFDRGGVVAWNTRELAEWDDATESRLREAPIGDDAELADGKAGAGPEVQESEEGGVLAPGGVESSEQPP